MGQWWRGAPDASERADEARFEEFVHARLGALLTYAHVLTGNRATAEDVVQTALARTAAGWHRVRRHDDPEGYVRKAILNTWLNSRRGGHHLVDVVAEPPEPRGWAAPAAPPDDQGVVERDAMWQALATLPPGQRAVMVLRYYEDLSEAEIAVVLGVRPGTVKSQAAKAVAHLRQVLSRIGVTT